MMSKGRDALDHSETKTNPSAVRDKIIKPGSLLFAIAMAAMGAENLICAHVPKSCLPTIPPQCPFFLFSRPYQFSSATHNCCAICVINLPPCTFLSTATRASIESLSLGAVATELHVAPASGVVSASIEKEPSAGLFVAFANVVKLWRRQQNGGSIED